jgi:S1-C subfamily serine protease
VSRPGTRPRLPLLTTATALALVLLVGLPGGAEAKGSLSKVEDEFERAIGKITPATVVCLARGVDAWKIPGGSSGVIVSRKGLVLSDGDVGVWYDVEKGKKIKPSDLRRSDDVEIRMPNLSGKGFKSYAARVLRRDRDSDTSLMRIENVPGSLKYLKAGRSDDLQVGDFAFVMGNSFGLAAEVPPTLTAGVIASLVPATKEDRGRWDAIYTSAAVNPGVNGGPLVDIAGRLVGTVSNAVRFTSQTKLDDPEMAYAYLGKVIPIDRLRALYGDMEEADEIFSSKKDTAREPTESAALATVFHGAAARAYDAVVSLEIKRKTPLSLVEPGGRGGSVKIPRFLGPVSGVLIAEEGWILTSLYNLANLATLIHGGRWKAPDNAKVKAGLEGIESITVHLPGGRKAEAAVVSRHEGFGIALLKADLGEADASPLRLLQPAPEDAYVPGRFVLALGNPFGAKRLDDPFLTVGILSKRHAETTPSPWAGQWQTDAGSTDANCGGAAIDVEGRLLGVMTIWSATQHGRNSGIGFIVPWTQIQPVLGEMKRGRTFQAPFMGVMWTLLESGLSTVLDQVVEDSPAAKAGLKKGDEIVAIDGEPVADPGDVRTRLRGRWSGDTLMLTVKRGAETLQLELVLGARN